jgi:16S rRNA (guanine966-N2)-methyltransferase
MKGKVRIIAGQWRGRKLTVLAKPSLRPTPNRVRETLFNWLNQYLPGSYCLDLFAGSGALGLEAASRGAQYVLLVEQDRDIVRNLQQQLVILAANQVKVIGANALKFLQQPPPVAFNILFLDPPFGQHLLAPSCTFLEQFGWLQTTAFIYLETEHHLGTPPLPASWQIIRQQTTGQVVSWLVKRELGSVDIL